MKKVTVLFSMVMIFLFVGTSNASLTTIGTATYMGSDYNLIYEDDSIDGGLVWLDYTNAGGKWQNQVAWASGLNSPSTLTYNLNYNVSWEGDWRLPGSDESQCNLSGGHSHEGPDASGYHDYLWGGNMVNSEMGHLFYKSLGNLCYYATDGTPSQPGYGLQNTADFIELKSGGYWAGTDFSLDQINAWDFGFSGGGHDYSAYSDTQYALAVRSATVSAVPLPSAIWLLGSGLIGLIGVRKKFGKE